MQIQAMSDTKVSPLQAGLPLQENLKNFIQEETQMMTSNEVSASSYCTQWQSTKTDLPAALINQIKRLGS